MCTQTLTQAPCNQGPRIHTHILVARRTTCPRAARPCICHFASCGALRSLPLPHVLWDDASRLEGCTTLLCHVPLPHDDATARMLGGWTEGVLRRVWTLETALLWCRDMAPGCRARREGPSWVGCAGRTWVSQGVHGGLDGDEEDIH